jgi:hypothetical protein
LCPTLAGIFVSTVQIDQAQPACHRPPSLAADC